MSLDEIPNFLILKCFADRLEQIRAKQLNIQEAVLKYDPNGTMGLSKSAQEALADVVNLLNIIMKEEQQKFLKELIDFEHYLETIWTQTERKYQKYYRECYDAIISKYESEDPLIIHGLPPDSFIELMVAKDTMFESFKSFLQEIENSFRNEGIQLVTSSGPKKKDIGRAFFKVFYVYDNDCRRLTDMLRCSFVFENFGDIYRAFHIIENSATSILRVKDRFEKPSCGYRDLMINLLFSVPGAEESVVACEIQLHHKKLYENKQESHDYYKILRVFDGDHGNKLYKLAKDFIKPSDQNHDIEKNAINNFNSYSNNHYQNNLNSSLDYKSDISPNVDVNHCPNQNTYNPNYSSSFVPDSNRNSNFIPNSNRSSNFIPNSNSNLNFIPNSTFVPNPTFIPNQTFIPNYNPNPSIISNHPNANFIPNHTNNPNSSFVVIYPDTNQIPSTVGLCPFSCRNGIFSKWWCRVIIVIVIVLVVAAYSA